MKLKYSGEKPEINGNGFNFRVDGTAYGYYDVRQVMYFSPDLQPGYELLAIPRYTPPGWVFKYMLKVDNGLAAVYEPLSDDVNTLDAAPTDSELSVYIVKTTKLEFVEDV